MECNYIYFSVAYLPFHNKALHLSFGYMFYIFILYNLAEEYVPPNALRIIFFLSFLFLLKICIKHFFYLQINTSYIWENYTMRPIKALKEHNQFSTITVIAEVMKRASNMLSRSCLEATSLVFLMY